MFAPIRLLKMDSSGFILYEGAFNHNSSLSIEKGVWDTNVGWFWRQNSFPAKDIFYFSKINTYNEFYKYLSISEKEKNNDNNIIKTNKTSFIIVQKN